AVHPETGRGMPRPYAAMHNVRRGDACVARQPQPRILKQGEAVPRPTKKQRADLKSVPTKRRPGGARQSGRCGFPHLDTLRLQEVLQLACLEHLPDDIAAADELAFHIELRDRGPVGIGLDAVAQIVRFQHIQSFVSDAEMIQDLHHLPGESAHRELWRALHEHDHVIALNLISDELLDRHGYPRKWRSALKRSSTLTYM